MPTGWRPNDVKERFKRDKIIDVYNQQKYKIEYRNVHFLCHISFIYINVALWLVDWVR